MSFDEDEKVIDVDDDEEEIDEADVDDEEAALQTDDDDDSDETSLDELLSQRAAARKASNDDETEDIMALTSERDTPTTDALPTKVIPIKDRKEFVCSNCHLVKARSQLADEVRIRCRDCV